MCTYQPQFISRYSRLSSILDLDTILAQQMQREVTTVVMKCLDLGVVSLCSVKTGGYVDGINPNVLQLLPFGTLFCRNITIFISQI